MSDQEEEESPSSTSKTTCEEVEALTKLEDYRCAICQKIFIHVLRIIGNFDLQPLCMRANIRFDIHVGMPN